MPSAVVNGRKNDWDLQLPLAQSRSPLLDRTLTGMMKARTRALFSTFTKVHLWGLQLPLAVFAFDNRRVSAIDKKGASPSSPRIDRPASGRQLEP